ncbi:MAG: class I SAM-dependent DNA methyltransferase [Prochlorotrichaceae cyanobacterium]|jgi:SAM-dependent methyltransferase
MQKRNRLKFPASDTLSLEQDQAYFLLLENEEERKIRFHDYDEIYRRPGLYEQLFYDRLKCSSPKKVAEILSVTLQQSDSNLTELRVLDVGAGNGMMGEALKSHGISRLVGVDIIPEAYDSLERDRPGLYDDYFVMDLCNLSESDREAIQSWNLDCLTTVAALGFGDIPVQAFVEALRLVTPNSWVAFNVKETFLEHRETTGFSKLMRELIFSEYLNLYHLERYRHRLSIEGKPLYYFAIVGRKNGDIPEEFIDSLDLS